MKENKQQSLQKREIYSKIYEENGKEGRVPKMYEEIC